MACVSDLVSISACMAALAFCNSSLSTLSFALKAHPAVMLSSDLDSSFCSISSCSCRTVILSTLASPSCTTSFGDVAGGAVLGPFPVAAVPAGSNVLGLDEVGAACPGRAGAAGAAVCGAAPLDGGRGGAGGGLGADAGLE